MKNQLFAFLILSSFFACKKSDDAPAVVADKPSEQTTKLITVDSRSREYILYLPTAWNKATSLPLLFALHGGSGNDSGMVGLADFRSLAERDKFILVYPQGIEKNWNDGRPTTANLNGVNDVNFFNQLIADLSSKYTIDSKRIYVTGISNGGFMSSRLGCELSNKFAAFAAVSASIERNTVFATCTPANAVSAMYLQGTADPLVPFLGGSVVGGAGGAIVSHVEAVTKWIGNNGSSTTAVTTNMPDNAPNDGTTSVRRDYNGGRNNSSVVSIVVTGGGHTWPQGPQYLLEAIIGKTTQDFNACETIWEFFKTHPKP
jgi:polyhydroxybutyrate depolymerase